MSMVKITNQSAAKIQDQTQLFEEYVIDGTVEYHQIIVTENWRVSENGFHHNESYWIKDQEGCHRKTPARQGSRIYSQRY